ncbi:MAG: hypothetical protein AAFY71_11355 [Bacteroidota bacterium]
MKKIGKPLHYAFGLAMLVLCFPMLYQMTKFYWTKNLLGYQAPPKDYAFSWTALQDSLVDSIKVGSYQANVEKHLRYDLRAKHMMIRFNNELKYDMYGEFTLPDIAQGKEGWLFNPGSFEVWKSQDYTDSFRVERKMRYLKKTTDTLELMYGTKFLFFIAPSKAAVIPEFHPDSVFTGAHDTLRSYRIRRNALARNDIPVLDTYPLFLRWKEHELENIFTKGGVHWSQLGAYRVWDTLYRRIEDMTGLDMIDYSYQDTIKTKRPNKIDRDLADAANLLWSSLVKETYQYPKLKLEESQGKDKPSVLIIGDSFFWNIHQERIPHQFFAEDFIFYYYFREAYNLGEKHWSTLAELPDFEEVIANRDLIMVMINLTNMQSCCWGFLNDMRDSLLGRPAWADQKDEVWASAVEPPTNP